jgi:hypothetical protein
VGRRPAPLGTRERYGSRDAYVASVEVAAAMLVAERLLLPPTPQGPRTAASGRLGPLTPFHGTAAMALPSRSSAVRPRPGIHPEPTTRARAEPLSRFAQPVRQAGPRGAGQDHRGKLLHILSKDVDAPAQGLPTPTSAAGRSSCFGNAVGMQIAVALAEKCLSGQRPQLQSCESSPGMT